MDTLPIVCLEDVLDFLDIKSLFRMVKYILWNRMSESTYVYNLYHFSDELSNHIKNWRRDYIVFLFRNDHHNIIRALNYKFETGYEFPLWSYGPTNHVLGIDYRERIGRSLRWSVNDIPLHYAERYLWEEWCEEELLRRAMKLFKYKKGIIRDKEALDWVEMEMNRENLFFPELNDIAKELGWNISKGPLISSSPIEFKYWRIWSSFYDSHKNMMEPLHDI